MFLTNEEKDCITKISLVLCLLMPMPLTMLLCIRQIIA